MAEKKKIFLYDEYLDIKKQYTEYKNVIILAQCGDFYEMYTLDMDEAIKISDITGIQICENTPPYTASNPLTIGFPYKSKKSAHPEEDKTLAKYLHRIIQHNYTVVLWRQTEEKKNGRQVREVVGVYSKSTYLQNILDTKFTDSQILLNIYVEYVSGDTENISISYIDISTGYNVCILLDQPTWEDVAKYVQSIDPKEITLYIDSIQKSDSDFIKEQLNFLEDRYYHLYINKVPKDFIKPRFQITYLTEVFSSHVGIVDIITQIGLANHPSMIISYMLLLEFAKKHNMVYIKKLQFPTLIRTSDTVDLSDNAIIQLNLAELYKILNYTSTPGGQRLLKQRLYNPTYTTAKLHSRYLMIESALPIWQKLEEQLKHVKDLERLHRKIYTGKLFIKEFYWLYKSYAAITTLIKIANEDIILKFDDELVSKFKKFKKYYTERFELDNLIKYNADDDILVNIFRSGYYPEVDNAYLEYNKYWTKLKEIASQIIDDETLPIRYTKIDGYYIAISKKKSEHIKLDSAKIKTMSSGCKVTNSDIETLSRMILINQDILNEEIRKAFAKFLTHITQEYFDMLNELTTNINELDIAKCGAKMATQLNYVEPTIDTNIRGSYIDAKQMRHPIIELTNTRQKYIANDVSLNKSGLLIYGINYSGKTSYIRAIGCCIIMAQAGLYVPAQHFKFIPFKMLKTKIAIQDNLMKNQSTFINEMGELKSITKDSNEYTLVLADELCATTTMVDALAIVGATIWRLSQRASCFAFTTHLHELTDIDIVHELKNVTAAHMNVTVDEKHGNQLTFNRVLKPGKCQSEYGIEVASHLGLDNEFIAIAYQIRDGISKVSRYNSNVLMKDCKICGKRQGLHTHHIEFQKNFKPGDKHKNMEYNLVVLCQTCHENVHHGRLRIDGYKETTTGPKLEYHYEEA